MRNFCLGTQCFLFFYFVCELLVSFESSTEKIQNSDHSNDISCHNLCNTEIPVVMFSFARILIYENSIQDFCC